ncbi:hypothetical protein [Ornithinibacillus xuwenensis]|uniref:LysM domain-containing protein n=1 Tax=Ornithinibacillus xuwenensis TaxID=3144668 RepID=A0ABU9XCI7_9BACI
MMRKFLITILSILFIISVYKDLNSGTPTEGGDQTHTDQQLERVPFDVIKVKITTGDTVLSVVEKINPSMEQFQMEQIEKDFSSLNPHIDPTHIKANHFYFFPKYNQK